MVCRKSIGLFYLTLSLNVLQFVYMGMPSDYVIAFLKLQEEMFLMGWEDARMKENWYVAELWMSWRASCKYRLERKIRQKMSIEDIITECEYQLDKTEELKLRVAKIGPRSGPNSDIFYLFDA